MVVILFRGCSDIYCIWKKKCILSFALLNKCFLADDKIIVTMAIAMYCFCTLKSVKVARLFGAPTWAPTGWMGLTIPSSVFNLNRVTPASKPAAHNLSLTSLKLRHTWETAHTHALIRPTKTDGNTLGRERSADHLGSHYTTQAITVCLSLSVSLSSATDDDLICSYAFLFRMCKTREPVVMVTHALNWPSYRLAFLHVSSFPTGIFFSFLLVHLHKSLAHSGHYVELM